MRTNSDLVYPIVHFLPQNGESKLISAKLPAFCPFSKHIWPNCIHSVHILSISDMRIKKTEFVFGLKSYLVYSIVHFSLQNGESKLISVKMPAFCTNSVHIWHENGENWNSFWNKMLSGVSDCQFLTKKWGIKTNFCETACILSTFLAYLTW